MQQIQPTFNKLAQDKPNNINIREYLYILLRKYVM